jgi:hypothetical protein
LNVFFADIAYTNVDCQLEAALGHVKANQSPTLQSFGEFTNI